MTTKLFLVQFLIEADVTEWPDFDERKAVDHLRSRLRLSPEDKVHRVQAYMLARKPDDDDDKIIEEYINRGFEIEISQDAQTVGTDVPTYFAVVTNLQAKKPEGSVVGHNCESSKAAKEAARVYVDKRLKRNSKPTTGRP